jgi:ammonia channel protein AmtB
MILPNLRKNILFLLMFNVVVTIVLVIAVYFLIGFSLNFFSSKILKIPEWNEENKKSCIFFWPLMLFYAIKEKTKKDDTEGV